MTNRHCELRNYYNGKVHQCFISRSCDDCYRETVSQRDVILWSGHYWVVLWLHQHPGHVAGVFTPNKISLTTIVTYLQKSYRSRISNHWATIPACSVVPPILQTVQENILSRIILATYRKFTVATVRLTQNVSCNIYSHPRYQQVANVTL